MKRFIAILVCLLLLTMSISCSSNGDQSKAETARKLSDIELYASTLDIPMPPVDDNANNAPTIDKQDRVVFVSKSGGKIHKSATCSGMKYYKTMTESEARKAGYSYCQNCY